MTTINPQFTMQVPDVKGRILASAIFSAIAVGAFLFPFIVTLVKYDGLPTDGTAEFIGGSIVFALFVVLCCVGFSVSVIRDSRADLAPESYENLIQEVQNVYGLTISTEQAEIFSEGIRGNSRTKEMVYNGEGTEEIMRFGKFETFADDIYTHVQLARIRGQWQLLDLSEGEGGIKPLAPRETVPVAF